MIKHLRASKLIILHVPVVTFLPEREKRETGSLNNVNSFDKTKDRTKLGYRCNLSFFLNLTYRLVIILRYLIYLACTKINKGPAVF